jgi:hypothetical protein
MLAKIIVGVAGVLAIGAGTYLYFEHSGNCSMRRNCGQQTINPTRTPDVSVQHSCCTAAEPISTSQTQPEILEIMPREVN